MKPSLYSPTRYIHILTQLLDEAGKDPDPVLKAFEMEREVLAHPEGQMHPLQALALYRALADLDGGSDVGIRVGKRVLFGALGDAGHAMLSCATLGESLRCQAEFHALIGPSLMMHVEARGTDTELRWLPVRPIPLDFLRVAYDMAVGSLDTMLASVLGSRLTGYDVYFSYLAPPHADQYWRMTKARCHFDVPGLPSLRVRIDTDLLNAPMPLSNPAKLASLREQLTRRLALTPPLGYWTDWVRMMVEQTHGEQPSIEELASLIQVSPSTLTRYLSSEGTNFRKLSNEIRHQRACQWLREGQIMVTEISQRLGYANLTGFVRAFKAISGVSPTHTARSHGSFLDSCMRSRATTMG
jgi:AraC-like DNA-binding protein